MSACSIFFRKHFGSSEAFGGPGGFRKLREACRKNFHLVAHSKTSVVTSYDQKQSFSRVLTSRLLKLERREIHGIPYIFQYFPAETTPHNNFVFSGCLGHVWDVFGRLGGRLGGRFGSMFFFLGRLF